MPLVLANRVQETATSNTTVSFTLTGAVTGFQTFAAIGNGNTTYYAATDSAGNWEVGVGTYSTTGPTLTRTNVYASSNSNLAVTFSGTVDVFVTYPSNRSVNLDESGNVSPLGTVSSGTWQGGTIGINYGGTGTTTPSLVAGTNVTISGAWPNQTINASGGGGGSSPQVGQVYVGTNAPTTGTWLETNKYYSKATYPALAAVIGNIEDFGNLKTPTARFPLNITYPG